MRLPQLALRQVAVIKQVHQLNMPMQATPSHHPQASQTMADTAIDPITTRLNRLGFVAGEPVEIVARGIFGGEPILVKVGVSRFALRRNEAARIEVEV